MDANDIPTDPTDPTDATDSPADSAAPSSLSPVDLAAKLATFDAHWSPRTVATFNGHDVMVAKLSGEYPWHHHDDTDDLFLVLSGHVTIRLPHGEVHLGPGQLHVVPAGMEHQPVADGEAEVLLLEVTGTPNSGDPATAAPRIVI